MQDFNRDEEKDLRILKRVRLAVLGVLAIAIALAQLDLMGYFGQW